MIPISAIWSALLNHLWQSTIFAAGAILLSFVLRSIPAKTRYGILMAASLKFLVPFSLFIFVASQVHWSAAQTVDRKVTAIVSRINAPFSQPVVVETGSAETEGKPGRTLLLLPLIVWLAGFAIVVSIWLRRWYEVRLLVRTARPLEIPGPLPVLSSEMLPEPAIFGIFTPVLLFPKGIETRLSPSQLAAVYAHELAHWKRRDNLTAALHMFLEAVFWFHPLVWWLGGKLLEQRELACDEAVVQAGNEPQIYAEGILEICKFCVASPLPCASGVSGADLKKRIEMIMSCSIGGELKRPAKLLLACCVSIAAAAPFAIGLGQATAQFEVASIKPTKTADGMTRIGQKPDGRFVAEGIDVKNLIMHAYDVRGFQVTNLPSGIGSERFDIDAKGPAASADSKARLTGEEIKHFEEELQALLADRFKLKLHHETKETQVYALVVAKSGLKMKPTVSPNDLKGRGIRMRPGELTAQAISPEMLAKNLSNFVGRIVTDNTGLTGKYDMTLSWTPDRQSGRMLAPGDGPAPAPPSSDENGPSIFTAVEEQLGLKLVPQKGSVDILVIDHIEPPSAN